MTIRFKTRLLVLATALSCAVAGVAAAADVKPRLIRFGYGLNEESVQGRAARFLAQELEKVSDGKLKMRTFGSATLGSDEQMQGALAGGAQEMMVGSTAPLAGMVKEFGVFDLPFLFNSEKEADAVLDGKVGQDLLKKLEAKGLVGLVYWENGFRNMTNSKHPIVRAEDMQGIKLRVMQNQIALGVFNTLGANAVPMPFSELFTALETRTVDGQENPITTIQSSKFYEVQPFLTITRHVYTPWVVLASKKWWDTLSPDEQKLIRQAAAASRDFERKDSREDSTKAMATLEKAGMKINTVSPEEVARMRQKVQPVVDKYTQELGPELIKQMNDEIQKARN
ncbi:Extracytoplasmic solute receptor protein yiaO [Achromobacter spanius]|jgi:tripartite ATP-independent transporter DctP family solute receptor|uniref:TRAP transporter substrate-binding protein n=1 Tax=Achromobacter spanius TaxID=217203 RepID=A0AA42LUR5_9BURK|nr:TRAP transporter substrate-binding protein [Achromobacter spanius]SPT40959.1 Extracytoplasmic solute receptor protein yiaO [Achromobacter denitrificans]AUA57219.1 ABC transporter substrate-binding protein [Achromobacter spanius]MDH0739985.1 TRAP transporter substrate-binding protein [Achromobacter spanius]CAB3703788.1 2,3-diketo-L-gulonate-binding periplasmic protein YiaO [Achromobacter spanius]VEE55097.1 Extracytoplasmic solute receptor protein yiaO [Achromobacter spanius]